jgi:hypothetical protein
MRVAVLHTGALHESTLGYAQGAVCAARRLAHQWARGDLVSVAVVWAPKPHGLQSGCARFDRVRVLQWNASAASSATTAGHQREAWRALRVAIDAALELRAEWMFRVRFDAHVSVWNVPLPADALWAPDCIYGFKQSWGWPSDNALLFPARVGRALFDRRLPDPLNELRLAHTAGTAGLRFCWVRVDVWLFKPERAVLGTNEGSVGVRRWTTPPALSSDANGRASQPARNYDPATRIHERARHASWATYAEAPLAWATAGPQTKHLSGAPAVTRTSAHD